MNLINFSFHDKPSIEQNKREKEKVLSLIFFSSFNQFCQDIQFKMYSDKFRDLRQKKQKNDYTSPLDTSINSNKSKNSFKEALPDNRNYTPNSLSRPKTALQDSASTTRVKGILNNLVQTDSARGTQLFGQCLQLQQTQKTEQSSASKNKGHYQGKFQFQLSNKLPRGGFNNETAMKNSVISPATNRESTRNYDNQQNNLYYMFQNQPSEPSLKQNLSQKTLTLSQLARQYQQKSSKNSTPKRNNFLLNSPSNNYLEQIQQLKQRLDTSLNNKSQRSSSQKNEKPVNQQLLIKNLAQLAKQNTQTSTQQSNHSQSGDETIQQTITRLILQNELLWNQLTLQIDKMQSQQLASSCCQLQRVIKDISEKPNSEYLYKLDPNIIDTFLLESYTILIMTAEYIKVNSLPDDNLKNLISYVSNSNFYIMQIVANYIPTDAIKQRIEMRKTQSKKYASKGKQTLYKNNALVRSMLELMQFPKELTTLVVLNLMNKLALTNQQKRILQQIARDLPKDSIESTDTLFQNQSIQQPFHNLDVRTPLPQAPPKKYTLVLDLDETLVHYQEVFFVQEKFQNGGGQFLVRPYAEEFIEALAKYYEIVIFTAAMPDYANFIIDIIDKSQVVSGRLYRDHCICKDNVYIKDISILGRNITKVIIVDNMPENFQLQPENGIYIQSWTGDQKDRALKDLQPLLEQIAIKKVQDVRVALNQFREQMIERVQLGIKNPYQNLQLN